MDIFYVKNKAGLKLHFRDWPVENPRSVIALVHGLGEHIARYMHVAEWMNRHGIAMVAADLEGHGRSEGRRGHARNLNAFLNDVKLLLQTTQERYPGLPIVLYGHSMGGNLVLNYALRRKPDNIRGVIATAPWIRLTVPAPPPKVLTARILHRALPTLRLPSGLAVHFLSHDEQVVEMYKFDAFVHDQISLRAGIALHDASLWLEKYTDEFPFPLLLMHGDEDKITDWEGTADFAKRVGGDVHFKAWPGMYHEIHNEPDYPSVLQYEYDWMAKRGFV